MARRLGEEDILKFFDNIDQRDDKDQVYKAILYNLIYILKKDGITFILSMDGVNTIYVTDVRDRIFIMKILKKYFLEIELYEVLEDIDTIIKTHQEVLDEAMGK